MIVGFDDLGLNLAYLGLNSAYRVHFMSYGAHNMAEKPICLKQLLFKPPIWVDRNKIIFSHIMMTP